MFFFYEILLEFLRLKPITTHFENLNRAISLDLAIVDYQANTKNMLISGLNDLKESVQKIENKHDNFLRRKSAIDKEADVHYSMVFYKEIEEKIEIINKKSKALIDNKYLKLEKMQRLLILLTEEANLPKFLEVFNRKMGNDFSFNTLENPSIIGSNKEALIFLFHVLRQEKSHTSINQKISLFIKDSALINSKADTSILDNIEFEDLIEFSFYYIFTLLYSEFITSLSGFNTKLSYSELVASNVFFTFKFQSLEILIKKRKDEEKKFLGKKFKDITEYNLYKKNILEEIKLHLETFQHLNRSLLEMKSLETSLITQLKDSQIPMPEKDFLFKSLQALEEKQKACEAEYQKIEKHKFNNKSKSKSKKITKNTAAEFKHNQVVENNKSIQALTETLSALSENLSESLKCINETKLDVNQVYQKIASELDQVPISINNYFSSLNELYADSKPDLKNSKLSELLKIVENSLIGHTLIKREFKDKLVGLIRNLHLLVENIAGQVNLFINKFHNCNSEMEKTLNLLSASNSLAPRFFSKSSIKEIKPKTTMLNKDYILFREQLNFLKRIINLLKCDTDEIRASYNIIKKLDVSYQKTYKLLNKKMSALQRGIREENSQKNDKKVSLQPLKSIKEEDLNKIPEKPLKEEQSEKLNPSVEKTLSPQESHTSKEHSLLTEIVKSTDECNKIRARLEGEYANKQRAKTGLRAITSASRYNFLISRIDPMDVGMPPSIENADYDKLQMEPAFCLNDPASLQMNTLKTDLYNHSQPESFGDTIPAPTMFFPVTSTIVDTYRLESRTVFTHSSYC